MLRYLKSIFPSALFPLSPSVMPFRSLGFVLLRMGLGLRLSHTKGGHLTSDVFTSNWIRKGRCKMSKKKRAAVPSLTICAALPNKGFSYGLLVCDAEHAADETEDGVKVVTDDRNYNSTYRNEHRPKSSCSVLC